MKLVFVHGRGQGGNDPVKLQERWVAGLRRGFKAAGRDHDMVLDVAFPFYGDRLDALMKQLAVPSATVVLRGGAPDAQYEAFLAAMVGQLARRAGISEADVRAETGLDPIERGWFDNDLLQGTIGLLPKKIPWLQRKVIQETTRDVWQYLTRPIVRKALDEIVAAEIPAGPSVVVAHSLGTIVAYRVLTASTTAEVPLFVTAGSPLGLGEIQDRLRPPVLGNPASTAHWLNAADRDDVVALVERLDRTTFSATCDIENIDDIDNGKEAHSIERYLADPRVAARVADALSA